MDDKLLIAGRVAQELRPGTLVNLGIGLPTLVAGLVPRDAHIFFQSENGIVGMQAVPEHGLEDDDLTDAGGRPISALPGAATFDSAMSFGLVRGGHLDVTVLGGLQVDRQGPPGQLDGARQDGARHGRRHGPGDGRAARHRGHDTHRQG
jgi:acetate CoA/acetoacetate CoA-transferase beta subunit